jgi:hypothetical protein
VLVVCTLLTVSCLGVGQVFESTFVDESLDDDSDEF